MEFVTNSLHGLVLIVSWLGNNAELVIAFLVASGVVSGVLNLVKKARGIKNKIWLNTIHYIFALIPLGAHYVMGLHSSSPLVVLGQGLVMLGTNQFIYPAVIKPISDVLSDAKAQAQVESAQEAWNDSGI